MNIGCAADHGPILRDERFTERLMDLPDRHRAIDPTKERELGVAQSTPRIQPDVRARAEEVVARLLFDEKSFCLLAKLLLMRAMGFKLSLRAGRV